MQAVLMKSPYRVNARPAEPRPERKKALIVWPVWFFLCLTSIALMRIDLRNPLPIFAAVFTGTQFVRGVLQWAR
jgi:hypothetical protein